MTADRRRLAWAYLSRVVQGPCAALSALIEMVGVVEAARAVREWDLPETLRSRTEARHAIDIAAQDLDLMARLGGRLVTPDDPDWPAWRLLSFARLDPAGDQDDAEPLALWVRGADPLADLLERSVGVVGARAMSSYGGHVTADVAGALAAAGWVVVSGAAYGVDGAAHRAALAAGGRTVAVLAGGVDRPYPAGHARLIREIADNGLVVSEYPPGTLPAKHRFLVRNRLVAAFSAAVLVVEAGARSGARNTAAWARKLGRPALAMPGSVLSAMSVGCHTMIRDGEARLVTNAAQVIDEAGPLRLPDQPPAEVRPTDHLTGDELRVYEAFPATAPRTPRQLSEASGIPLPTVRAILPHLELSGHITEHPHGWHRKPHKPQ